MYNPNSQIFDNHTQLLAQAHYCHWGELNELRICSILGTLRTWYIPRIFGKGKVSQTSLFGPETFILPKT